MRRRDRMAALEAKHLLRSAPYMSTEEADAAWDAYQAAVEAGSEPMPTDPIILEALDPARCPAGR